MNKITSHHLDRQAIVYVRQSTLHQVQNNQESTRLQYGLKDKALQLGWPKERIVIIDSDLGCSGSSVKGRLGFQHLVAEVCLDHVGIILGLEVSRLARSCSDWYQLLENCARFATLICDQDGVYDPVIHNDRLLLGLKGTMSEIELYTIKQRLLQGARAKAQRGELSLLLPMGYIRRPSGEVIKDPDEQAQGVINILFETFERKGSVWGVFTYLIEQDIRLPCRLTSGPCKGELEWRRPHQSALIRIFHHPIYAGAYTWGRSHTDPRKQKPGHRGSGRTVLSLEAWQVLLKDRLPAYISWAQFELNQQQIKDNRVTVKGAVRKGSSLLSGLLICGRCGHKMATRYTDNGRHLRYLCVSQPMQLKDGAAFRPECQSLSGKALDAQIEQCVLNALKPAALEVSLAVASDIVAEQKRLQQHWAQKLERAKIESQRMYRQYNAVEPENRLVARTLEKEWEAALASEEKLQQEYEAYLAKQVKLPDAQTQREIKALAQDIPGLWQADTTKAQDKQQIIRLLIEQITVTMEGKTEQVQLDIRWTGGQQTQMNMIRPVKQVEQLSNYAALQARVKALYWEELSAGDIARILNEENWRSPKPDRPYTVSMIGCLLNRMGLSSSWVQQRRADEAERDTGELTLNELSGKLDISVKTLQNWVSTGKLKGRKVSARGLKLWLVQVDDKELARLIEFKSGK